jgi:hypothetical protein
MAFRYLGNRHQDAHQNGAGPDYFVRYFEGLLFHCSVKYRWKSPFHNMNAGIPGHPGCEMGIFRPEVDTCLVMNQAVRDLWISGF